MSADHATAYDGVRRRVGELAQIGPDRPVPATPGWTVRNLVAHLAGLAADWVAGRLEAYASAGWTASQVEERKLTPLQGLLDDWGASARTMEGILTDPAGSGLPDPLMTAFGPVASAAWPDLIVTDAAMHEHDIRGAVGEPGARTSNALQLAMRSHVGLLRFVAGAYSLPPLELQPSDGDRVYRVGRDEPQVLLRASLFELFRATGGRRSLRQIAAMDWFGDPGEWARHIVMPSYTAPEADLVE